MVDVVKRTGKRQKLSRAKIAKGLEKAAKDAKVKAVKRRALAKEISTAVVASLKGKRSIKASALRTRILSRLERKSKASARSWRKYDKKRRK